MSAGSARALLLFAGMLAGPITYGLVAKRYLDPSLVIVIAFAVAVPLFIVGWRRRPRPARRGDATLLLIGLAGASYAAVATLDLALDWHAPESHVVNVLGSDTTRTGLRGGVLVQHFVYTSSWRDAERERIAVHEAPPFARADFRPDDLRHPPPPATAWQMVVETRAGALGLPHVVSYSYRAPAGIAVEQQRDALAMLAQAVDERLAQAPTDGDTLRLQAAVAQLQGKTAPQPPPRDAHATLVMYLFSHRTSPDPGEAKLAQLVDEVLTTTK